MTVSSIPEDGRGRPLRDLRMNYGPSHCYLLAHCAHKANRILWSRIHRHIDPEELMAEGWWRCMRRVEEDDLKKAVTNTVRVMVTYALDFYIKRNGLIRAKSLEATTLDGDWDQAMNSVLDPLPEPSHLVDLNDYVGFLREHLDQKSYRLIENLTCGKWSVQTVAKRRHITEDAVRYQRKLALQKARRVLAALLIGDE